MTKQDKRKTVEYLMKHGLSVEEAKIYIEFGTNFDFKTLSEHELKILDGNF
jgi:hypothetical protein